MADAVYSLDGIYGSHIEVYEDKAVIKTKPSVGALWAETITHGEKTILYMDCVGVQFKKCGFTIGLIQLETASAMAGRSNVFNENTFTFGNKSQNEKMEEVANYIRRQVEIIKKSNSAPSAAVSPADELKKFKDLLDMGVITQEEFDAKKKQILGL